MVKRKITKRQMHETTLKKDKKRTYTFTIPEDLLATEIVVTAAGFPIAIKPGWSEEISHKTGWCNNCGKCCLQEWDWELGTKYIDFRGEKDAEVCQYAFKITRKDGSDGLECRAGPLTPLACSFRSSILIQNRFKPECSLEYDVEYEIVNE